MGGQDSVSSLSPFVSAVTKKFLLIILMLIFMLHQIEDFQPPGSIQGDSKNADPSYGHLKDHLDKTLLLKKCLHMQGTLPLCSLLSNASLISHKARCRVA